MVGVKSPLNSKTKYEDQYSTESNVVASGPNPCVFVDSLTFRCALTLCWLTNLAWAQTPSAAEANPARPLQVGWAVADITPPWPVALIGQLYKRISDGVRDPLTATVLALETKGGGPPEQAILVSCDLLFIQRPIQQRLRERVRLQLPDFDSTKLFLNATHNHTGPGLLDSTFKGLYDVSQDRCVRKASEYAEFFLDRVSEAVVRAWKSRKPGSMSWALSEAVVGYNRRAQYRNGSTVMYGNTRTNEFMSVEGSEDHTVSLLFFWGPGRSGPVW